MLYKLNSTLNIGDIYMFLRIRHCNRLWELYVYVLVHILLVWSIYLSKLINLTIFAYHVTTNSWHNILHSLSYSFSKCSRFYFNPWFFLFCGRQGCFPLLLRIPQFGMRKSDLRSSFRTKRWLSCFDLFPQDQF